MGSYRIVRRPRGIASLLLAAVLAVAGIASVSTPTHAAPGTQDVVPNAQQVIGGCQVRFDAAGNPYLAPSRVRPCVGASGVSRSPIGDVVVRLSWSADDPQTRLFTSADTRLTYRGITVGATRTSTAITLRFYDDVRGRRVDLRREADRARLASGGATVGWVGVSPTPVESRNLGLDHYGPFHDKVATDATTVPGGCVIRFASTGPWIHANGSHHCTGLSAVGITSSGKLRLISSAEQIGSIINISADPDETLTTRGVVAGTSTATREIHVQLYDTVANRPLNLTRQRDRDRVAGEFSNIWFTWTKTTARPGAVNATYEPAKDKYGAFINGSAAQGDLLQVGCEIRFSALNGRPEPVESTYSDCTGVDAVAVDAKGHVLVYSSADAGGPIVGTSTVSSRSLTDYGIRAGASGGDYVTSYQMYSVRLGRSLSLNVPADRVLLQRSGSSLYLGWTRPW